MNSLRTRNVPAVFPYHPPVGMVLAMMLCLLGRPAQAQVPSVPPPPRPQMRAPIQEIIEVRGQNYDVFPNSFIDPWNGTSWAFHVPFTVESVEKYDEVSRLQRFTLGFSATEPETWAVQQRLAGRYLNLGLNRNPSQISLRPLTLKRHEILLRFDGHEVLVDSSSEAAAGEGLANKLSFRCYVPADQARLHDELINHARFVHVVFRAYYDIDDLAVCSVTVGSLQASLRSLSEKIKGVHTPEGLFYKGPNVQPDKPSDASLVVHRDAVAKVKDMMTSQIRGTILTFGYSREEREPLIARLSALALSQFEKLPSVKLATLTKAEESQIIYSTRLASGEIQANTTHRKLNNREHYNKEVHDVESLAESLSDIAANALSDHQFFQSTKDKLTAAGGASASFVVNLIPFNFATNINYATDFEHLDSGKQLEVRQAREYLSKKTFFKEHVYKEDLEKIQGEIRDCSNRVDCSHSPSRA